MPDEDPIPELPDPDRQLERDIIHLLTGDQTIWSVEELGRETETPNDSRNAVEALQRAGMIHRIGDYVFASRQSYYLTQTIGYII
ncbi:MAG TPA: hypothetical protein VGG98_07505 [Solirubrobacteraceae bacterium]|jgi:hypothetical protein